MDSFETSQSKYTALFLCAFLFLIYSAQTLFGLELAYRPGVEGYRFLTSIFGHSSLEHLLNNLFFLGLFGTIYELQTNSKVFLGTFLVSGLLANLTAFVFYPETFIIGASAGAMGVLSALAVYKPKQIGLGLGVPMPMWAVLIAYIFIDLVSLGAINNTANEAHLAGLLVGGLMGYRLKTNTKREKKQNKRNKREKQEQSRDEEAEDDLGFDNWEQRIREWEEKWMK